MKAVRCGVSPDFTAEIVEKFKDTKGILTWNGFLPRNLEAIWAYQEAIKDDLPIICIETPLLGRKLFEEKIKDPKRQYFRLGLYGVCSLSHGIVFSQDNRLGGVLENTGEIVKPWRNWEGDCIVYALQNPGDMSLVGLDIWLAVKHDLMQMRFYTKLPIYVTVSPYVNDGHDTDIRDLTEFCKGIGVEVTTGGSEQFLDRAKCFVMHSSGTSVDCMLAGVPCITLHHGSPCYGYTNHWFNYLSDDLINDRMNHLDRNAALNFVAGYQFNIEELLDGWPIKKLLEFHNGSRLSSSI